VKPSDAPPEEALVIFLPSGLRGRFPVGTPLLEAGRRLGVDIDSVCGGRGICGRCQVTVSEGDFPKFGVLSRDSHLVSAAEADAPCVKQGVVAPGRRLSCAVRIAGDLVVDVPPDSQLHKQIVRKRVETRAVDVDPMTRLHYVEIAPATIDDQRSDRARLMDAMEADWALSDLDCGLDILRQLPPILAEGGNKVTVAVREGARIVAIWPGYRDRLYGLAVDVGTTTIAAHLCDLATGEVVAATGTMNPQIRFGEDLISRISFIQDHPDQADLPTAVVREAIGHLAAETAAAAGIDLHDIVEACFVGNSTMHHILLGLDPTQLGRTPFPLVVETAVTTEARTLDLDRNPGARAYLLPCIAGHVGADTAAVLLSEAPHASDDLMLIIDVGTNAEIVLGNRERLIACSSPTGPAFEGAQISCGQRAAPGAIERVRIDPVDLTPRFKVVGSDKWSDEDGFDEAIAATGVTGICGSGIIEAVAEMYRAGLLESGGLIDGSGAERSHHLVREGPVYAYRLHAGPPELRITQTDVRSIQLAKAALYAGTRLLMDRFGIDAVDRIVLAGAFGSYIDPTHAMILGMIPDCRLDRVSSAGNAAGTGARIALLSRTARAEIEALVGRVEKIETASQRRFQDYFVAAMAIPHKSHRFPHLESVLARPENRVAAGR
jgi:uncharacterized 2Fe-2S/4Fe-4S cluster protein (DUF4445 family)